MGKGEGKCGEGLVKTNFDYFKTQNLRNDFHKQIGLRQLTKKVDHLSSLRASFQNMVLILKIQIVPCPPRGV